MITLPPKVRDEEVFKLYHSGEYSINKAITKLNNERKEEIKEILKLEISGGTVTVETLQNVIAILVEELL